MNEDVLRRTLPEDITPRLWYEFLNRKVFLWANAERLYRMARAYLAPAREVIVVDTRRLVDAYRDRIRLSHMNSGATRSPRHRRSYATFCRLEDYFRKDVAEICVDNGVPDILSFVRCVREIEGGAGGATIYRAEGSDWA